MLVIQNRKIKKGIEIPEIEMTISNEGKDITFGGIDKEKYADFLALEPHVYSKGKDDVEVIYPQISAYIGDQITIGYDLSVDQYGIFYIYIEIQPS